MGEFWIRAVAAAAIAYFCGCFNGAVIVSKYILRDDVRTHGNGNAGLTNFYRTFGGPLTFGGHSHRRAQGHCGPGGGRLAAGGPSSRRPARPPGGVQRLLGGPVLACGHMFPCMFQFKGGKGILSGGTIVIMIDWRVALVAWGLSHPGAADPLCVPGLQLHRGDGAHFHLAGLSRRDLAAAVYHHRRSHPLEAPGEHPAAAGGDRVQVLFP